MRHAIGFGLVLLLGATGEGQAAGNQPFCLEGLWVSTGGMRNPRSGHAATLLPSGKVLVTGGFSGFYGLATAELYDPATATWSSTGSMSIPRGYHTMTLLPSGKVLVAGGDSGRMGTDTRPAELYDPDTGQWTTTGAMRDQRQIHTATLLPTGKVLVAGGFQGLPLASAEIYDPATGQWQVTGALSTGRLQHSATQLPSGRVLVVGAGGSYFSIPNTELYDPESETWSDAGCLVEARGAHTATLLRSGHVLVAGGINMSSLKYGLGSAELYGIVVSPAQVSLAPGASQTFSARGGSGFNYVWSFMQNKSGGTLTPSGAYQAGPVGGVTDVVQVVDSFANSATATVNVTKQASALSPTSAQANSMGCGTTGGATLPLLAGAVLVLLGWTSLRILRPRRAPRGRGRDRAQPEPVGAGLHPPASTCGASRR